MENLQIQEKHAPFIYRLAAMNLDQFLFALVAIVIGIFTGAFDSESTSDGFTIILSLFFLLYSVYFIKIKGATLGKQFFKLKVKVEDGSEITWWKAIIRESLGKILSSIVFSLGYLWSLWDPKKQTWHDKMVGTVVIQTEELGTSRKVLAYLLAFGLVLIAIVGILVAVFLLAINPSAQIQKAQEQAQKTQQVYENPQISPLP